MLSRVQARSVDRYAIDKLHVPGIVLMENAARGAVDIALGLLAARAEQGLHAQRVGILTGGGNNGGDGWAMARHLVGAGLQVGVFAAVPVARLTGDARVQADICLAMGLAVTEVDNWDAQQEALSGCDVLVDGLLGTGFSGEVVRQPLAAAMGMLNRLMEDEASPRPWVLALDLPSGLDCDTGVPATPAVHADATATFVAAKRGFGNPAAAPHIGQVFQVGIGLPPMSVLAALKEAGGGCCNPGGACPCKDSAK